MVLDPEVSGSAVTDATSIFGRCWPSSVDVAEGVPPVSLVTGATQGDANRQGLRDGQ
ncbi:hypothetical protein RISK_001682 [Rhodopirellula islandica]|uniref:Uncharacterized protein n=1 Tax=Rhodopirellula islandica TaxID=595434 RepID=A0A0J1BIV5_RHOIS|nr:hypothetical protein RISK_001682 [Rhodopirellula islandica]